MKKKNFLYVGLLLLCLSLTACSSNKETTNEKEEAISTTTSNKTNDGKDVDGYLKLLADAEKQALKKEEYMEAYELILYAQNEPAYAGEEGENAIAKGEDYMKQLQALDFLNNMVKGEAVAPDNEVRSQVKKAIALEQGSEKLNEIIQEKQEKYFKFKAAGKYEEQASREEEAKRVGTEGYKPDTSDELEFTKGVNNYGEVLIDGATSKTLEGVYTGGYLNLSLVRNGTCIDVVPVKDDESFVIEIDGTLVENSDTNLMIIPTDDTIKKGDTEIEVDGIGGQEFCTLKILKGKIE